MYFDYDDLNQILPYYPLSKPPQMTKIFQNLGGGLDKAYKILWTFFI